MGKIVSNFYISLDGVVESPEHWHFPYFNEQMGAAIDEGAGRCDAFLMGRTLYDEWVEYWPKQGEVAAPSGEPGQAADDFAAFINGVRKYVVSHTLTDPKWDNTVVLSDDVAAGLRAIKDQTDGDIGMSGSATLVRWLLAEGLVDELHLLVHPIVVGSGHRLFEGSSTTRLQLTGHETFETGVLNLTYVPAMD
jgi:dihydrofolate reductase